MKYNIKITSLKFPRGLVCDLPFGVLLPQKGFQGTKCLANKFFQILQTLCQGSFLGPTSEVQKFLMTLSVILFVCYRGTTVGIVIVFLLLLHIGSWRFPDSCVSESEAAASKPQSEPPRLNRFKIAT